MRQFFLTLVVVLIAIPNPASAADVRFGETVFLNANEYVADNVYVSGGQITLSSTLAKDAVVLGGRVIINGVVSGDVIASGGTVDILERVSGDVRIVGGQVTVAGPVQGDLIVAGGAVHLLPGSTVSGDVIIIGGQLIADGAINGAARLYGGDITVNGLIGRFVSIRAGNSVTFGDRTIIGESLTYSAPQEALVSEKAQLGADVTFHELDISARSLGPTGLTAILAAVAGLIFVTKLLAGVVATIALVLLVPRFSITVAESAFQNFWKAVGIGFIIFIVVPAAILVLAITIVGSMVALVAGILYALVLLLASLYAGVLAGSLIARRLKKESVVSWKWAALGFFVLFAVSLLPFIGWIFTFVLFLAALGTLGLATYNQVLNGA